jgi:L-aspartate oxidase
MTERAGVLRSRDGLESGADELEALAGKSTDNAGVPEWETTNLLTVSAALLAAARMREETRGSHWREDFPDRDDVGWSGHIDVTLDGDTPALHYRAAEG